MVDTLILFLLCVGENTAISSKAQRGGEDGWYKSMLSEEDASIMEHSGKMVLLFEILRMAEELNDKVYVSFLT